MAFVVTLKKINIMDYKFILAVAFLNFFTFSTKAFISDSISQQTNNAPLFESEEPLKLTLIIDVKTVKNDNSDDPQYSAGKLTLHKASGDTNFDIQVKARGHSRRLYNICSFPPIKLNFKKKKVANTIFDGQNKLKLVTHCNSQRVSHGGVRKLRRTSPMPWAHCGPLPSQAGSSQMT